MASSSLPGTNTQREMTEAATSAVHPECYQEREQPRGSWRRDMQQVGGSYQGTCRLIHNNAGPMTGRSCHPRDMTSPRIDSAAPLSACASPTPGSPWPGG